MKQNQRHTTRSIIWTLLGLCILFSCSDTDWGDQFLFRKQEKKSKHKNEELTIDVAKQWYEAYYEPVVTTRSSERDTTKRLMMPYWDKAKEANRKRYEVVEIPIKTKGSHLIVDSETALKWQPGIDDKAIRNTAKIVIEKDKITGRMRSFIMIFVGSYDYLHKTKSMGKNSYLYRQPDFDGYVLFHELNGSFVNGWKYENGKIVERISPLPDGGAVNKSSDSIANTRALVEECYEDCITFYDEECFTETSIESDAEYGQMWVVTEHCIPISYQECRQHCFYYDDGTNDKEEDNWWEQPDPPGGSETTPPPPPVDDDLPPLVDPKKPIELMDKSKFVGWRTDGNCLTLAQETLKKYGLTNYGSSANVFRLVEEKNGVLSKWGSDPYNNYENAIKCIDDHLNANRPIIVGVNHTPNLDLNEGTTDHFVVITGRGYDPLLRLPYYTFMDNATSVVESGCSDSNRFYYTTGNSLGGTSEAMKGVDYTVSQVRPNNGKKYDTTTGYK